MTVEQCSQDRRNSDSQCNLPMVRSILGIIAFAFLASLITLIMGQMPQQPIGSQHDSLHTVWYYQDSSLYPLDRFAPPWREQPTIFWRFLSLLIPNGSEGIGLLTWGSVATNFLFFIGVGLLAQAFSSHWGSPYACMALLGGLGDPLLGANYLTVNHLIPVGVVAGPLLLAIALSIRGRLFWGLGIIGLMANIHFLQAFYVGMLVMAGTIAVDFDVLASAKRRQRQVAVAVFFGLVCALPAITWIVAGLGVEHPDGWAETVRNGHRIHYLISSQDLPVLLNTLSLTLVLIATTLHYRKVNRSIYRFLLGLLGCWLIGFVAIGSFLTDVASLPQAILFQPLRATSWMIPVTVCAGIGALMGGELNLGTRCSLFGALLGIGILQFLRPSSGAFLELMPALVLALSMLALVGTIRPLPDRVGNIAGAVSHAPLLLIVFYLMGGSWPLVDFVFDGLFPLVLMLILVFLGILLPTRFSSLMESHRLAIGAPIAMNFLLLVLVLMARVQGQQPIILQQGDAFWLDACRYVREHTDKTVLVQGHPLLTGLRSMTRRSVFFEQNDDGLLYVDPSALPELNRRAALLGLPLVKSYTEPANWHLSQVDWNQLAGREGVTHAIVPSRQSVPGRILYENGVWSVVQLRLE
jgi:hypothetical protein